MPDPSPRSTRSARSSFRLLVLVLAFLLVTLVYDRLKQSPDWRTYRSEEAGFTVAVAGRLHEQTREEEIDAAKVTSHYVAFSRDEVEYAITWVDLPTDLTGGQPPADVLALARTTLAERLGGQAVAQQDTAVEGCPASAFRVQAEDGGVLVVRSLLAGQRLFTLMATARGGGLPGTADLSRFLASFDLAGPGGPAADTLSGQ